MTKNYMVQTLILKKEKNEKRKISKIEKRKKIFLKKNHVCNKFTLIRIYFNNSILF